MPASPSSTPTRTAACRSRSSRRCGRTSPSRWPCAPSSSSIRTATRQSPSRSSTTASATSSSRFDRNGDGVLSPDDHPRPARAWRGGRGGTARRAITAGGPRPGGHVVRPTSGDDGPVGIARRAAETAPLFRSRSAREEAPERSASGLPRLRNRLGCGRGNGLTAGGGMLVALALAAIVVVAVRCASCVWRHAPRRAARRASRPPRRARELEGQVGESAQGASRRWPAACRRCRS